MSVDFYLPTSRRLSFLLIAAGLALGGVSGCAGIEIPVQRRDTSAAAGWGVCAERCAAAGDATQALIAYHDAIRPLDAAGLAREHYVAIASADTHVGAIRAALVLARTGDPDKLISAIEKLNAVVRSSQAEAQALAPLARLLEVEFGEQLRLKNESQARKTELEKTARAVKEQQRRVEELQSKLKALTEIERSLPGRLPGGSSSAEDVRRRTP